MLYKKNIITILLALVAMTGQAQTPGHTGTGTLCAIQLF